MEKYLNPFSDQDRNDDETPLLGKCNSPFEVTMDLKPLNKRTSICEKTPLLGKCDSPFEVTMDLKPLNKRTPVYEKTPLLGECQASFEFTIDSDYFENKITELDKCISSIEFTEKYGRNEATVVDNCKRSHGLIVKQSLNKGIMAALDKSKRFFKNTKQQSQTKNKTAAHRRSKSLIELPKIPYEIGDKVKKQNGFNGSVDPTVKPEGQESSSSFTDVLQAYKELDDIEKINKEMDEHENLLKLVKTEDPVELVFEEDSVKLVDEENQGKLVVEENSVEFINEDDSVDLMPVDIFKGSCVTYSIPEISNFEQVHTNKSALIAALAAFLRAPQFVKKLTPNFYRTDSKKIQLDMFKHGKPVRVVIDTNLPAPHELIEVDWVFDGNFYLAFWLEKAFVQLMCSDSQELSKNTFSVIAFAAFSNNMTSIKLWEPYQPKLNLFKNIKRECDKKSSLVLEVFPGLDSNSSADSKRGHAYTVLEYDETYEAVKLFNASCNPDFCVPRENLPLFLYDDADLGKGMFWVAASYLEDRRVVLSSLHSKERYKSTIELNESFEVAEKNNLYKINCGSVRVEVNEATKMFISYASFSDNDSSYKMLFETTFKNIGWQKSLQLRKKGLFVRGLGVLAEEEFYLIPGTYEFDFFKCVKTGCFKAGTEKSCVKVASEDACIFEQINLEVENWPEKGFVRIRRRPRRGTTKW